MTNRDFLLQAVALLQADDFTRAEELLRWVLTSSPRDPTALNLLGVIHQKRGDFAAAEKSFRESIAALGTFASAWHNLGNVLIDMERLDDAIEALRRAVRLDARFHEAHNALAFAQRRRGDFERAIASCRRALDLRDDYAAAWHNLGLALLDLGRTGEAIDALFKGSVRAPSIAQLHVLLVRLLREAGRMEEAERAAIAARSHHPRDRDLMTHVAELASEHRKAKRAKRSEELLRALLADWPETPELHVNLANSLSDQQRIEAAVDACRAALDIDPAHPEARSKLVAYLRDSGRYDESLAVGLAAVAADERFIEARVNLALTQLTLGLMPEGWHNYEARLKAVNYRFPLADLGEAAAIKRYWTGRELSDSDEHGGVLLVFAEQGLGDTLQFLRFLPAARARSRRLVFAVQKSLIPLLRSQLEHHASADAAANALGFDELTPHLETWPAHDAFVSLMSLPHIFGTTLDSFSDTGPQVRPTLERLGYWRRWFEEHHPRAGATTRRIGIAWQGNRAYARDPQRSIPLAEFRPLVGLPDVELFCLQYGDGIEQLDAVREEWKVKMLPDDRDTAAGAFRDTVAILQQLDLIVTSDSAIAHLVGAAGRPTWMALPHVADWRWLVGRDDSPWYPTMRIYRQPAPGDWPSVFAAIARDLGR